MTITTNASIHVHHEDVDEIEVIYNRDNSGDYLAVRFGPSTVFLPTLIAEAIVVALTEALERGDNEDTTTTQEDAEDQPASA